MAIFATHRYMYKHCPLLLFFLLSTLCFPLVSHGQQVFTQKGILFKKGTADRISQAFITNPRTRDVKVSDELGDFSIDVIKGDTLLFTKKDFERQTMIVINSDDIVVYLQPILKPTQGTVLNEVTIKEQTKQQELSEVMREYQHTGIYNNGNSLPLWTFLNSPVSGFYQLFAKGPKDARRFQKDAKVELENSEVDRRYNRELVKRTTGLPDEEAQKFMQIYTPSYQDIKAWNDYQIIVYIKRCYGYYKKNKKAVNLQKLY